MLKQLLLNIVRAHAHRPVHFTAASNVAATFNFQVNVGATPPLGGLEGGFLLSPIFGGSISENPTISIVPIEGKELTKRLLTSMNETTLISLMRQGTESTCSFVSWPENFEGSMGKRKYVS